MKLYHNPRCSKSRQALKLLREAGFEPEIILYLIEDLSVEVFLDLLQRSSSNLEEHIRCGDDSFKDSKYSTHDLSDELTVAKILAENQHFLQRPLLDAGSNVIIARPPELVLNQL